MEAGRRPEGVVPSKRDKLAGQISALVDSVTEFLLGEAVDKDQSVFCNTEAMSAITDYAKP